MRPTAVSRRRSATHILLGTGANTVLVALQAVVLIPLYLRTIGPELFGSWLASGDVLVWLQVFDLGLANYIIQRIGIAHARGDRSAIGPHFSTALIVLGAVGASFAILAVVAAPWLAEIVGVLPNHRPTFIGCFRLAAVATAILLANNAVVGLARGIQDAGLLSGATALASTIGFATSFVGIYVGWGLWAISAGIAARVSVIILASIYFIGTIYRSTLRGSLRPSAALLREFASVTPATAAGGAAYSLASQSENFLIAVLVRPEAVPIYNLSKKAAEMLRALFDSVGHASYGALAHLAHSDQRHRSRTVYNEIKALRLMLATAGASAYIVVNQSLMSVWVGEQLFGGLALTALVGLQLIVGGQAYLLNYLYRAVGSITKGSLALVAEGSARLLVMGVLVSLFGIVGAPLGAIITGVPATTLYDSWINRALVSDVNPLVRRVHIGFVVLPVLALALSIANWIYHPSWTYVLMMGVCVSVMVVAFFLLADPRLVQGKAITRAYRARLCTFLSRGRSERS